MTQTLLALLFISGVNFSYPTIATPSAFFVLSRPVLAEHDLNLKERLPDEYGSRVFADNILLALHFLKGDVKNSQINWEEIRKPFTVSFTLESGEIFAFHGNALPEFGKPTVTMNSRFFLEEGYLSLAGLGGNGVCHLASLINWVASDAGLEVTAKVNHDFYPVPGVPRERGTSIMSQSPIQNLYVKNSLNYPVEFTFAVTADKVDLSLSK